jgi:hypothetical protein
MLMVHWWPIHLHRLIILLRSNAGQRGTTSYTATVSSLGPGSSRPELHSRNLRGRQGLLVF